jgi:hypothetical protein
MGHLADQNRHVDIEFYKNWYNVYGGLHPVRVSRLSMVLILSGPVDFFPI